MQDSCYPQLAFLSFPSLPYLLSHATSQRTRKTWRKKIGKGRKDNGRSVLFRKRSPVRVWALVQNAKPDRGLFRLFPFLGLQSSLSNSHTEPNPLCVTKRRRPRKGKRPAGKGKKTPGGWKERRQTDGFLVCLSQPSVWRLSQNRDRTVLIQPPGVFFPENL